MPTEIGVAGWIVVPLALLVVIVSALSAVESRRWWIRIWDFPRIQILTVALAVAFAALVFTVPLRWPVLALLAIAALWQFYRIFPYTVLARHEVAFV